MRPRGMVLLVVLPLLAMLAVAAEHGTRSLWLEQRAAELRFQQQEQQLAARRVQGVAEADCLRLDRLHEVARLDDDALFGADGLFPPACRRGLCAARSREENLARLAPGGPARTAPGGRFLIELIDARYQDARLPEPGRLYRLTAQSGSGQRAATLQAWWLVGAPQAGGAAQGFRLSLREVGR